MLSQSRLKKMKEKETSNRMIRNKNRNKRVNSLKKRKARLIKSCKMILLIRVLISMRFFITHYVLMNKKKLNFIR